MAGIIDQAVSKTKPFDLPLDEPILTAHKYGELTAEQVKAAYARWLRPKDLVEVTEGPTAR
jgi:zinc protease